MSINFNAFTFHYGEIKATATLAPHELDELIYIPLW